MFLGLLVDVNQDGELLTSLFPLPLPQAALKLLTPLEDIGLNLVGIGNSLEGDICCCAGRFDVDVSEIEESGEEAWSLRVDVLHIAQFGLFSALAEAKRLPVYIDHVAVGDLEFIVSPILEAPETP